MKPHKSVVGVTAPRVFRLTGVGSEWTAPVIIEAVLCLYPSDEPLAEQPLTAEWIDEAARTVRVTGGEDLDVGSYLLRFELTKGISSDMAPSGEHAFRWDVVAVGRL